MGWLKSEMTTGSSCVEPNIHAKHGLFDVPCGTDPHTLQFLSFAEACVKKFISHYEKDGWVLVSKPKVRPVKKWTDEYAPIRSQDGKATIWIPTSTGMREDHPFYKPGTDQYTISAYFKRNPRPATFDIPQDVIQRLQEKGKWPKGLTVKE